jgi:hypothetical protein
MDKVHASVDRVHSGAIHGLQHSGLISPANLKMEGCDFMKANGYPISNLSCRF